MKSKINQLTKRYILDLHLLTIAPKQFCASLVPLYARKLSDMIFYKEAHLLNMATIHRSLRNAFREYKFFQPSKAYFKWHSKQVVGGDAGIKLNNLRYYFPNLR